MQIEEKIKKNNFQKKILKKTRKRGIKKRLSCDLSLTKFTI